MANLDFCDQHNIVGFLKKPHGSTYFHQIVDFFNSTHTKYAFTENPIIYVSLIRQFWQTASSYTSEDVEIEITASIDGRVKSVTEASIRRHLKLEDSEGPIQEGEGSTVLVESHPTPAGDPTISQSPISSPLRLPLTPHDLLLPGGHTRGSKGGRMTLNELTVLCTTLSKKVESLESDLKQIKLTYGAAYSKLIIKTHGRNEYEMESDFDFTTVEDISIANVPVTTNEIRRSTRKPQNLKGVAFKDVEETPRPIRHLPSIDPKDKELAQRLYEEELEEVNRAQKEGQKQEEDTIVVLTEEFDEIQARIDVDHKLVARLTHEEQVQFTIEERARLLAELFERRKKQLVAEVPRDDIAFNVESLATKYPIVDWKTHILTENMMYYQIIRGDGSSKNYKIFSEMLNDFNRQDVIDLHRLVQERYDTTSPEGYDLLLWEDLKILFELNEDDDI
uniref:Xylulose kinase-1 n=1 Tax=Tanacetum cinerariifolium TaxID=118510 RepID=A0A6L2MBQ5_TANCI|nr:hypothetical protein [Tanacetum cinerariifolium]